MDRHDYQETTQLVSHKRKEVGGEAAKEATRNDRRRQDSYDDESENGTDERQEDADEFGQGDDTNGRSPVSHNPLTEMMSTDGDDDDNLSDFDQTQHEGYREEREDVAAFDVLKRHQAKNGRRKVPSPTRLVSVHSFLLLKSAITDICFSPLVATPLYLARNLVDIQ
jgi:hypothetical protein